MLRTTLVLALAVSACASTSDGSATAATNVQPGFTLAYDPARTPGFYAIEFVFIAGEARSNGALGFELRARPDARFDLFVTRLADGDSDIRDPRMREHPVHDLSIDARGPADARLNPEGFLKDGSDLAESFMFLLPETPPEPVDVGAKWTGTRTVPMGKVVPEHPEVTIEFELLRFEPCPPSAAAETCAAYRFEANTGPRSVTVGEQTVAYTYQLAGTGRFSVAGQFVTAEAKLEGSIVFGDQPPQVVTVEYAVNHQ